MEFLVIVRLPLDEGLLRDPVDLAHLRHVFHGPKRVLPRLRIRAEDSPVEDGRREKHLPLELHVRAQGDDRLPQQAVRPLHDLVELRLGPLAALLRLMARRDVDHHPRQVPLVRTRWPNDDLLGKPVQPVRPDDAELLVVVARALGKGRYRGQLRPLVVGRLLILPEAALVDQGRQPVGGIVAKLWRPDLPVVGRPLARHPRPPEEDVRLVKGVQDQLVVLQVDRGIGARVPSACRRGGRLRFRGESTHDEHRDPAAQAHHGDRDDRGRC